MTGHFGISKSIAVQLYWYLSNIICSYRCREHRNPKLGIIIPQVPKLLYWNINLEEGPNEMRKKLLKQCS